MSPKEAFERAARDVATAAQARISQLEQEALELKARLAEKEAERDAARSAPKRLLDLPITVGADYACPRCWIARGKRSAMRTVASNTADDIFECRVCGFEVVVQPF
jgi:predicted RNA-binding Zn-ribbon protein involved in translation (DUF1610 family)